MPADIAKLTWLVHMASLVQQYFQVCAAFDGAWEKSFNIFALFQSTSL